MKIIDKLLCVPDGSPGGYREIVSYSTVERKDCWVYDTRQSGEKTYWVLRQNPQTGHWEAWRC